jgi:hypothetical protein
MPTAAEFRDAAQTFDQARQEASTMLQPIVSTYGPDVITGGVLTAALTRAFELDDRDVATVVAECSRLDVECRWRATQCDLYTEQLAIFRRLGHEYDAARARFDIAMERHNTDPDLYPRPGWAPTPPRAPVKRYDWIVPG